MGKARIKVEMAKIGARALLSTRHPILVHMVPMRRCNLACKYCNEFDQVSKPVPTSVMMARINKLAELKTSIVTFSGGEPLLHPDIDQLFERIAGHGMMPELLTNGFLLSPERIRRLNRAGLRRMQISIDNVKPDDISKKSLKTLDRKLEHLAEHAEFLVNINSVVGAGIANPEDALTIARRARALGFTSTVGIIHDGNGQLRPLGKREREIYDEITSFNSPVFSVFTRFKNNLVQGKPNNWRCRAGARYMYICEDGLVHRCSQQRGVPGTPLLEYTVDALAREFATPKGCAPMCTVSCVHAVAVFDNWRSPQAPALEVSLAPKDRGGQDTNRSAQAG
jgi:MoaA/NifB/PqqE/SkfB family radical SAM enzyme